MISSDCFLSANCEEGSRYDTLINRCVECPEGTYQDLKYQYSCKPCDPDGFITLSPGAVSSSLCVCEYISTLNLFPNNNISDWFKLKEFADDNFKSDENGRKFPKRVENTGGKREIAHYEQFLLCPQCFQKACTADM